MSVAIVASITKNRCIGKENGLIWHSQEDTKRMKELTIGKTVIMGRKTWESIPEKYRPLPKRKNVVVTRQIDYPLPPDVERISDLEGYIRSHQQEKIILFGGAEIYRQGLTFADTMYLTEIDMVIEGDAYFPEWDKNDWDVIETIPKEGFTFLTLKRKIV